MGISGSQLTKWRKDFAVYGENSFPGKGNEGSEAFAKEMSEKKTGNDAKKGVIFEYIYSERTVVK